MSDEATIRLPTRARPNWLPEAFIDPELAGSVAISPRGPFVAGSFARLKLVYTAGRFGIDDTGGIRVCFRFATDGGPPQFSDPSAPNFVSVRASNGAVLDVRYDYKLNTRPWDRTIVVRVVRGYMREGDTITLHFGDPGGGSPGYCFQTFVDPFHQFLVLADPIATSAFVCVADQPTFAIVAGDPQTWHAMLPTRRPIGEQFDLGIRIDDRWGNSCPPGISTVHLDAEGPLDGVSSTVAFQKGATSLRVSGLRLTAPGIGTINVRDPTGALLARSNPILAVESDDLISCWADLHAQSAETIGSSSIVDYCRYARDEAFLDAVGHQGNDFQITSAFWDELNAVMRSMNQPGRFVTVPGYEWSGNTALGGDRNVFFREEGRPIRRSSHALTPDLADSDSDCHDARALFAALTANREDAVCWAHCGGRYADIGFAHDVALERSIEIHSSWGTFEWLLRDAFAHGYRVGIVANSDGHKGRPGAEMPGASQFGAIGGLTCFLVKELSRDAIFDAMKARHHYATSGCRLHLAVQAQLAPGASIYVDDPDLPGSTGRIASTAIMGDIVVGAAHEAAISVHIDATSPILAVEIRRGPEVIDAIRPSTPLPSGLRFLVTWEGAEYKGRFRQSTWDGALHVAGNQITAIRPVNFFNPDCQPQLVDPNTVFWRSITTGNFTGVEFTVAERNAGHVSVETPNGVLSTAIDRVGREPLTVDCGKLDRRLSLTRLADDNPHQGLRLTRTVPLLEHSDNPIYVAVTLEDGHRAWSSPIYLVTRR
ncbi:MAG: DUF3604 domain-containing protein [Hyphomicrobiaceae bacterium]